MTQEEFEKRWAAQIDRDIEEASAASAAEKSFEDGWLGPEADGAAFLRSLGIEP